MACLVVMDGTGERAPGARRGIQVCQELRDELGCLDHLGQLGPKGTMALLEIQDQRGTVEHADFPALQVCLAQLEERVPLGSRAMQDPKAKQVQRESLDLKETSVHQACRALQGLKASQV